VFHRSVKSDLSPDAGRETTAGQHEDNRFAAARREMVEEQLEDRDIADPRVLGVMGRVARERFVPAELSRHAYEDHPLPIGLGQTISQPYIVALMAQLARPSPEDRALEVGVGSGYEAAILAGLCKHVFGIEILDALALAARQRLAEFGYANVSVRCSDGYQGWPEAAPFDVILVSAAPDHVPPPLIEQLAPGGRLVIPVGSCNQELLLIEKRFDGGLHRGRVAPVQFVPMIGEARKPQNQ
jgi:protein-L-isoaspartate(D-aspartate) O-methyltransferase